MARVVLTEDAVEGLRDLGGSARAIVLTALKKLERDLEMCGQPLGSRPGSDLTTFRKHVVGNRDYRVIYRIEPDGTVVVVWVIARRADNECYELALARLRMHPDQRMAELATTLVESAWRSVDER